MATDYRSLLPQPSAEGAAIPRLIHQIYIGKEERELAPEMQENIQHLQRLNPGWTYKLWGEAELEAFIQDSYPAEVYRHYRMISSNYRAAQADFARYLLIYYLGGVYLDVKSTFTRPIEEVLDLQHDEFIIYHWDNESGGIYQGFGHFRDLDPQVFPYGEYHQGFVIGRPRHPILHEVISSAMERLDKYNPFTTGVGLIGVLRTTGPILYSQCIERMKKQLPTTAYRQLRCIEQLGGRISIYDAGGAFAHRQKLSNYHAQLTAVSLNGSERWTSWLHIFFWLRWASHVFCDKVRMRLGGAK